MSGTVVVFGGRSEIGVAIAERLAPTASVVVLAVRPGSDAGAAAERVAARGARVEVVGFDADDTARHRAVVAEIEERFGAIDTAVLAFGILGDQERAERDEGEVVRILHTDFVAQASLLTVLADMMRGRGSGRIVAFSSVAGVRVRRANYVYGSAKAGLDGFASGLADALHGSGVDLVIARPGFVVGRMTEGMEPAPFSSTPDEVADAVVERLGKPGAPVLWIPWQLRAMFSVAPFVPRPVWRRMPR
ncbi:SDR family NAD(P)-dependent oxidoreductase [Propioniciclava sinopodophylli]|uniref:SDR family NAD(P)-dependent oxidoreductase n=1 Tax=Propioniciclava sinopodophylli TaxID=1837344 RepID=UPI0024913721|nr:SDR family NAD(P)-dependent oxidoreductase [Propioniciclava sinopodophylli]